jgi:hypothetical protein
MPAHPPRQRKNSGPKQQEQGRKSDDATNIVHPLRHELDHQIHRQLAVHPTNAGIGFLAHIRRVEYPAIGNEMTVLSHGGHLHDIEESGFIDCRFGWCSPSSPTRSPAGRFRRCHGVIQPALPIFRRSHNRKATEKRSVSPVMARPK